MIQEQRRKLKALRLKFIVLQEQLNDPELEDDFDAYTLLTKQVDAVFHEIQKEQQTFNKLAK